MDTTHTEVTQQRQTYQTADGHVDRVTEDRAIKPSSTRVAANIVYVLVAVINTLLALRFVLSLLGANRASQFGDLLYSVTQPLVAPFYGLFGTKIVYGQSRLELEVIVAVIIYSLLAWGITKILLVNRTEPEM